jgi:hypothetical protein
MRPPSSVVKFDDRNRRSGIEYVVSPVVTHSVERATFRNTWRDHTSRRRPPKTAMKHAENAPINSETKSHNAA